MKLKMEIVPDSLQVEDGFQFCYMRITIDAKNKTEVFTERDTLALNYWCIEDYERQWREGLERIKTHDVSCLVASIQNPYTSYRLLNWWPLYKIKKQIYVYNQMFAADAFEELVGNNIFSPDTCYDFIRPRKLLFDEDDEYKPSEWIVDLE